MRIETTPLLGACALLGVALSPGHAIAWGAGGGGGPSSAITPGQDTGGGYFRPSPQTRKEIINEQLRKDLEQVQKLDSEDLISDLLKAKEQISQADAKLEELKKEIEAAQKNKDQAQAKARDASLQIWQRGDGIEVTMKEVNDELRKAVEKAFGPAAAAKLLGPLQGW